LAEFIRQQSLIDQAKLSELRIAIIGAGAIGSYTALTLTKMGCTHLTVWDKDNVELHNISNQLFNRESLGTPKVVAVEQECKRYAPTGVDVEIYNEFYEGQTLDKHDVVIALTDNIEGRAKAFEAAFKSQKAMLFIDGRMGAETLRTFVFNPKDPDASKEYYEDYIEDVQNEELPCTARSIIYNVLMAASLISSYVKRFVQGEPAPFQIIYNFKDYSQCKSLVVT
jgi:molybdopterin/thiamine biosynthesis adenylyltransferase